MIGIYKITNKLTGEKYIGQATDIEARLKEHKQERFIPIDYIINFYGKDTFDYEIVEQCALSELDEKEQYYIKQFNSIEKGYNKQEGGFNNSIGEGNGRARLTEADVIEIRTAYANHQVPKELYYKKFKDKVTLSQFQAVWQGHSWGHIMKEVYTKENKEFYARGQFQERASLSNKEVFEYRKYYVTHTADQTYDKYLKTLSDTDKKLGKATFRKILTGDVKKTSIYLQVPVYKKNLGYWELNNKPVQTIPESWE